MAAATPTRSARGIVELAGNIVAGYPAEAHHSSAVVCIEDALALLAKGNDHSAMRRALKAVAHVVGIFHADYIALAANVEAAW